MLFFHKFNSNVQNCGWLKQDFYFKYLDDMECINVNESVDVLITWVMIKNAKLYLHKVT